MNKKFKHICEEQFVLYEHNFLNLNVDEYLIKSDTLLLENSIFVKDSGLICTFGRPTELLHSWLQNNNLTNQVIGHNFSENL